MDDKDRHIEDLIAKLQQNIKDIWRPEFSKSEYIINWLKARDYDLKKAEQMLRNHIVWRKKERVDFILEEFKLPEAFEKFGVGGYCGHDKECRPIWYEAFGRADPQGLLKSISTDDILKSRVAIIENMIKNSLPELSAQHGRSVTQSIVIFDMENFGRKHLWRPAMACTIEATKIMEANYPESMYKLYIFNAPPIFRVAFNIVRPFLHEVTRNKIHFLGKNFKEELLKIIDADQLPAYYGGNMYGPGDDPMCRHLIRWGGEVPASYYLNEHKLEMKNIVVKPRSKIKLTFFIDKIDEILYYEYSTKENDVSFGIYYIGDKLVDDVEKIKSKHLESVLVQHRKHAHIIIQKGEVTPPKIGYYLIEFDNSYSWTTTKHVFYHIEVLDVMKVDKDSSIGDLEE